MYVGHVGRVGHVVPVVPVGCVGHVGYVVPVVRMVHALQQSVLKLTGIHIVPLLTQSPHLNLSPIFITQNVVQN